MQPHVNRRDDGTGLERLGKYISDYGLAKTSDLV